MFLLAERSVCRHCSRPLIPSQKEFCCRGCEAVFRVLQDRGLSHFYDLRGTGGSTDLARPAPHPTSRRPFASWQDPAFASRYVAHGTLKLYLEGVHCLGCLWLVENLPSRLSGVQSARLDLGRSVAVLKISPGFDLEKIADELSSYGYTPVPLEMESKGETLSHQQNRKEIIRVGVAALAASNIMLSAIPLYTGVEKDLTSPFTGLSALLFLPVLFFAAIPFFESSWASLKRKSPSIDLPIAIAIVGGGLYSYGNLYRGSDEIYFDSLSMIVALLLGVRLLLRRIQSSALCLAPSRLESSTVGRRGVDGMLQLIPASEVKVGDWIELENEQTLPFDGILRCPRAEVDAAILTGEPLPQKTTWGEAVYAGSTIRGSVSVVEVTATGSSTRLASILEQARSASAMGTRWAQISDRVGRYFVGAVFLVILGLVAARWGTGATETFRRILAISVVSCPCAFAFAVPLAFVLARRKLALKGVYFSDVTALERLAGVEHVLLDKTGTLTSGQLEVISWRWHQEKRSTKQAVLALEKRSRHPVARAIVSSLLPELSGSNEVIVEGFSEQIGQGVSGTVGGELFKIGASPGSSSDSCTRVDVQRWDGNVWVLEAECFLQDRLRSDSKAAVAQLQSQGLSTWLLSGDAETPVREVADAVGIPRPLAKSRMSPEMKADLTVSLEKTVMVGDGANDAIALSMADVGVAVSGGVEYSLKAADLYLTEPGVIPVVSLIRYARKMRWVTRGNLLISILFNGVAISLAATGNLSPLFAAIFMPVSSLTVLLFTAWGMKGNRC